MAVAMGVHRSPSFRLSSDTSNKRAENKLSIKVRMSLIRLDDA